jgi:tryptophan synthase beta chain
MPPMTDKPSRSLLPDKDGFYGSYGGRYVPEVLYPNLVALEKVFYDAMAEPAFWSAYVKELQNFSGRPTPLTHATNLTKQCGGAQIYIKREDLGQTGAHKINNVIGQGLIAKRLGKTRVIAETGAGQHGVAVATMAARFGFEAVVYMGAEDVERQRPNVFWMERLGAKVVAVEKGSRTLKDAINEALRDWSANPDSTHYVLGTTCGPHPFPAMVSYFQNIIGIEARAQILAATGKLPKRVYACVGGGSNALGIFQAFIDDDVELVGLEAGGKGKGLGKHASRIAGGEGSVGIAQGYKTLFLQNRDGQMLETHSVSAGLDYVGISPIIADLWEKKRVRLERASDAEAVAALKTLVAAEGIIPALESSHGVAGMLREAGKLSSSDSVIVNLSGRGDKDIFTIAEALQDKSWLEFLRFKTQKLSKAKKK